MSCTPKLDDHTAYDPLNDDKSSQMHRGPRKGLLSFTADNVTIPLAFFIGTGGAIACFCFTYWLSNQIFDCPDWALDCSVSSFVTTLHDEIALVQGITSTIYGICMSCMAYATYQLAETTIWPTLTQRTFDLDTIDRYLSTTRGSIASAPLAVLHSRRFNKLAVLLAVTILSLLLKADATVVGYAFNIGTVPTTLTSSQKTQGGIGLAFRQMNPPPSLPGAVTVAITNYQTWAYNQVEEPMWQQREFMIDRRQLLALGNFTAKAVKVDMKQNCSAWRTDLSGELHRVNGDKQWKVATNMDKFSDSSVSLRLHSELTVWVDHYRKNGDASATTRLVFAAINGDIEGGYLNIPPSESEMYTDGVEAISTLACDVNVQLVDSSVCTYPTPDLCPSWNQDKPLSDLTNLKSPGRMGPIGHWQTAVWLGAMASLVGISVSGAQPLFEAGPALSSQNNITLPIPWTSDVSQRPYPAYSWTHSQLNAFVNTSAGALTTAITKRWESDPITIQSSKLLNRMQTSRSYLMLLPVAMTLASLAAMLVLTKTMHRSCKVDVIRLGNTTEMIDSTQSLDMADVVEQARKSLDTRKALSKVRVRYGFLAQGGIGLAETTKVTALRRGVLGRDYL
ncbi:uncharacterized protein RCC_11271 [Ramularia collo-cygni]|uniref:Uncharacterized protein n=1 Tax=Ramularia collo-cygni TaxID=112498 RepID=A0A2D3VSH6_9PEZI|nr:uncharacterized protein RCC_11271 [Ramularia collo-cygni]CZT25538.1 uncharacterized protein RCC_11271 [Ramularia collo-cygni]